MSGGVAWFPDYGHIVAGIFFDETNERTKRTNERNERTKPLMGAASLHKNFTATYIYNV